MQRWAALLQAQRASLSSALGQMQGLAKNARTPVALLRRQFSSQGPAGEQRHVIVTRFDTVGFEYTQSMWPECRIGLRLTPRNQAMLPAEVSAANQTLCVPVLVPAKSGFRWVAVLAVGTGAYVAYSAM